MNLATLEVKQNTLALPKEWVRDFLIKNNNVVATWLGDVLMIRPVQTVTYTKAAERKALKAIESAKKDLAAGRIKKLEGRLGDLMD